MSAAAARRGRGWDIGVKGDVVIYSPRLKSALGESKHVILTPAELAVRVMETVEEPGDLADLKRRGVLERVRELRNVVIYRVNPSVPIAERKTEETREVTVQEGPFTVVKRIRMLCTVKEYPDGRVEYVACEPYKEEIERKHAVFKHPHGRVTIEVAYSVTGGPLYHRVVVEPEKTVTYTAEELAEKLEEWRRELEAKGYPSYIVKSALRLMLASMGLTELANLEAMPPVRAPTPELLDYARELAEKYGGEIRVKAEYAHRVETDYNELPEDVLERELDKLTPAQRRIYEILVYQEGDDRIRLPQFPPDAAVIKHGPMRLDEADFECITPLCGMYRLRVSGGKGYDVLDVYVDDWGVRIIKTMNYGLRSIEDAARLAKAIYDAIQTLIDIKSMEEAIRVLETTPRDYLSGGYKFVMEQAARLFSDYRVPRRLCYEYKIDNTGETRSTCIHTLFHTVRVPTVVRLVEYCEEEPVGVYRREECYGFMMVPEKWEEKETEPAPDLALETRKLDPYPPGDEERRRLIERFRRRVAELEESIPF